MSDRPKYPSNVGWYWHQVEAGDLVMVKSGGRREAWRVVEVREVPEVDWEPTELAIRDDPAGPARWRPFQPPLYVILVPAKGGRRRHIRVRGRLGGHGVETLREHYPVCSECGEVWPCRDETIERTVRAQTAILETLCHYCNEPVSGFQASETFGGPCVEDGCESVRPIFHLRRKNGCGKAAGEYRERWYALNPGRGSSVSPSGRRGSFA